MKWLPERKVREEQEFNSNVDFHVQAVTRHLEQGHTYFELFIVGDKAKKAVEKRLNAAGWSVRWDTFSVNLMPLDTQTTE